MSQFYTKGQNIFNVVNNIILISTGFLCLAPFVNLLAISFSDSAAVSAGKVMFWPMGFTLSSYRFAILGGKFTRALLISIQRTLLGVGINLILMIFSAYPLAKSKERFAGRNIYMAYFIIIMIVHGGIIPTFLVVTKLGLLNSIWALVLPGALPVGTMVIFMNFIRQMPQDIEEAAMIDGAGVFHRLFSVLLPLLKPGLATVGLFCTVAHWNDWFSGIIYMQDPGQYPLQSYFRTLLISFEDIMRSTQDDYELILLMMINARTGRAAQLFLGALPMLIIYPFLQKYFTKGLVLGSVKG
jgi:putative aldouronate transport system permease protein